jgi:hypothetical protein
VLAAKTFQNNTSYTLMKETLMKDLTSFQSNLITRFDTRLNRLINKETLKLTAQDPTLLHSLTHLKKSLQLTQSVKSKSKPKNFLFRI